MIKQKCGNCFFAEDRGGYDEANCRRHAPIAHENRIGTFQAEWPVVSQMYGWCGDWRFEEIEGRVEE